METIDKRFPQLAAQTSQRNIEIRALVRDWEERLKLICKLEPPLEDLLETLPPEVVSCITENSTVQQLATLCAEINLDPLQSVHTGLLSIVHEKLEKLWSAQRQLKEEEEEKDYLQGLIEGFQLFQENLYQAVHNFEEQQKGLTEPDTTKWSKLQTASNQQQQWSTNKDTTVSHKDVVMLYKKVQSLKQTLEEYQAKLSTYENLPQDPSLASLVVEQAKEKLCRLSREKCEILQSMNSQSNSS